MKRNLPPQTTTTNKTQHKKFKMQNAPCTHTNHCSQSSALLLPSSHQRPFHELISDDVLALIFKFVSQISSFSNFMLVGKRFYRVLFSQELNCFEFMTFNYSRALQMPDTALVKRCIIMNDPSIMNQTSFPFSKLQYVELCSGDCSILSLLKILNKTEIHHICLNDGVSKELLQFIVNEFPNLRTLEVADFSDLERISTCNTSVTTFKWNHYLGHGKECYDMESINIHDVLSDLIAPCFPNLQHIEIENPMFHIDNIQLVRLWTNTTPLFPSLKKLSIHVVVYECEHNEDVLSRVEWMKFCDLKHLPELELSCEYSTVASLLLALFESKAKRLKIHVIDQESGGIRFSSMHELLENVFEQEVSTQLKGILSERISSKVITYETDYESSEESEDEEEEEEDDEDHDEDEEEDE